MFFPVILAAVCYPGADSKASSTGLWSAGAAGRCTLPRSASPSLLVLRPPLPFASVSSVGGSDAVSPEPPCPLCCWCCLIRRGALPACFLSTSCLRVGLGTALAPCITPSCRSICLVRHPRPSPAALPAPPTPALSCPALSCPPDLASPFVWALRQPRSQPHPHACSLPRLLLLLRPDPWPQLLLEALFPCWPRAVEAVAPALPCRGWA